MRGRGLWLHQRDLLNLTLGGNRRRVQIISKNVVLHYGRVWLLRHLEDEEAGGRKIYANLLDTIGDFLVATGLSIQVILGAVVTAGCALNGELRPFEDGEILTFAVLDEGEVHGDTCHVQVREGLGTVDELGDLQVG